MTEICQQEGFIRILPGQYYDKETANHYNYFRDYNPKTGRYIESDPIGLAGGINTFGYVDGNPITKVDPNGLTPLPPDFDPSKPPPKPVTPPTNPVRPPPEMPKPPAPQKPGTGCKALFDACIKFADKCGRARLPVAAACIAGYFICQSTGPLD